MRFVSVRRLALVRQVGDLREASSPAPLQLATTMRALLTCCSSGSTKVLAASSRWQNGSVSCLACDILPATLQGLPHALLKRSILANLSGSLPQEQRFGTSLGVLEAGRRKCLPAAVAAVGRSAAACRFVRCQPPPEHSQSGPHCKQPHRCERLSRFLTRSHEAVPL